MSSSVCDDRLVYLQRQGTTSRCSIEDPAPPRCCPPELAAVQECDGNVGRQLPEALHERLRHWGLGYGGSDACKCGGRAIELSCGGILGTVARYPGTNGDSQWTNILAVEAKAVEDGVLITVNASTRALVLVSEQPRQVNPNGNGTEGETCVLQQ